MRHHLQNAEGATFFEGRHQGTMLADFITQPINLFHLLSNDVFEAGDLIGRRKFAHRRNITRSAGIFKNASEGSIPAKTKWEALLFGKRVRPLAHIPNKDGIQHLPHPLIRFT